MSNFKHVVTNKIEPSFRTQKVIGMFDLQPESYESKSWELDINLDEKPWQIGLIVGSSGSGKTTLAKELFDKNCYHTGYEYNNSCFLDDFDDNLELDEILKVLTKVGFSSPPQWLLPYSALSNGQKFRVDTARALLDKDKDLVVFDEFTSVIDRTVARTSCIAVSKMIRETKKQFVAVSCHFDIEEYLQPDWVLNVSENKFYWGSLRRKPITLKIYPSHWRAWKLFRGNHYLDTNLNKAARCFIAFIDNEPVAFTSGLYFPHPKVKDMYREHRTVVLPDYQGLGIGNRISEWLGKYYHNKGKRFMSTTSHPSMIKHRIKSDKWILKRKASRVKDSKSTFSVNRKSSSNRLTMSFEYKGE